MFVIGLTGGIASGKSTVANILADKIPTIIDADEISKDVVAPGSDVFEQLVERFGSRVIKADGVIDRAKLGRLVFSDRDELRNLNDLTHPHIIKAIKDRLEELRRNPSSPRFVLLRVPLLIEVGLMGLADLVVVVVADEDVRVQRIVKHRNLSEAEARYRIEAQMPDEEKVKYADHVIENNGSLADLERQATDLWRQIVRREKVSRGQGSPVRP